MRATVTLTTFYRGQMHRHQ